MWENASYLGRDFSHLTKRSSRHAPILCSPPSPSLAGVVHPLASGGVVLRVTASAGIAAGSAGDGAGRHKASACVVCQVGASRPSGVVLGEQVAQCFSLFVIVQRQCSNRSDRAGECHPGCVHSNRLGGIDRLTLRVIASSVIDALFGVGAGADAAAGVLVRLVARRRSAHLSSASSRPAGA